MTHKPILEERELGRFDSVEVRMNTQGVLYKRNRFDRLIGPGENISFGESLTGGLLFYLVDRSPHEITWHPILPSKYSQDKFPLEINMKYRVLDSRRMVEEKVDDTDEMIFRAIEYMFRKETRKYAIYQYGQVEDILWDMLTPEVFEKYGLEIMDLKMEMQMREEEEERGDQIRRHERVLYNPQQIKREIELSTGDAALKFQGHVDINYRILKPESFKDDLRVLEERMWSRVATILRREARKFPHAEISKAEEAMEFAVDNEMAAGYYGLALDSIHVVLEPDDRIRSREEHLSKLRNEMIIESEKAELDEVRQARERKKDLSAIEFYLPFIQAGKMSIVAHALAKNEMDSKAVLEYLSKIEEAGEKRTTEEQQRKYDLYNKMFDWAKEKDGLSMKAAEDVVGHVYVDVFKPDSKAIPDRSAAPESQRNVKENQDQVSAQDSKDSGRDVQDGESEN